jgi:Conserved hypothetical protein 2217 (DUF2460)
MPTLPLLKTGAVTQYPAPKSVQFRTQVLHYVDGSEQRYREYGAPLVSWVIRLDLLDEVELAAMEAFFLSLEGRAGTFTFVDPRDNVSYEECSLDDDSLALDLTGEMRGRTTLIIRQNRS